MSLFLGVSFFRMFINVVSLILIGMLLMVKMLQFVNAEVWVGDVCLSCWGK